MTHEELIELFKEEDALKVAQSFEGMEEKERKVLFKHLKPLLGRDDWDLKQNFKETHSFEIKKYCIAELIILALAPFTQAKRATFNHAWKQNIELAVEQVLRTRNPDWIDKWFAHMLKKPVFIYFDGIDWKIMHHLILQGLVERPKGGRYLHVFGLDVRTEDFEKDPHLLEHELWEIFNFEPPKIASASSTVVEKKRHWDRNLDELLDKGLITRQQVLSALIKSLANPFRPVILRGFKEILDHFEPTLDDFKALQQELSVCFGATESVYINFAIAKFDELLKVKLLDFDIFFEGVELAFQNTKKAPAQKCLKLFPKILKQNKDLIPQVLEASIQALSHAETDIQTAAFKLIDKYQDQLSDESKEDIEDVLDLISATIQNDLKSLLNSSSEQENSSFDQDAELPKELPQFSEHIQKIMKIEESFDAIHNGQFPPGIVFTEEDVPRVKVGTAFNTFSTLEECTLYITSYFREKGEDYFEYLHESKVLDSISRFYDPTIHDDFKTTIKKLSSPNYRDNSKVLSCINFFGVGSNFPGLEKIYESVRERIKVKSFYSPISTPSYDDGFLSIQELYLRIQTYELAEVSIEEADLKLAIKRIAPEERNLLNNNQQLKSLKCFDLVQKVIEDNKSYFYYDYHSQLDENFSINEPEYPYQDLLDFVLNENIPWPTNIHKTTLLSELLIQSVIDGRWDEEYILKYWTHYIKIYGNGVNLELVDFFKPVSEVSPLHLYTCLECIEKIIIASQEQLTEPFPHFYEMYYELLSQANCGISEEIRVILSSQKGRSKSTKVAHKIAELPAKKPIPKAILLEAWNNRIARAESWS